MCNICFCLFTHSCEETENCGCSRLCLFFCFFPWLREVHVAPKPLSYHTSFFFSLKYYSAASSFFAHALFLCFSVVHLFASSLCFWHRRHRALSKKKKTNRDIRFFPFYSLNFCLAWWWQSVLCFSLSLPNKTNAALCQLWAWATLQKHCCLRKWSGIEEKVLLRLRVEACFLFPLRTCYGSLVGFSLLSLLLMYANSMCWSEVLCRDLHDLSLGNANAWW